MLKKELIWREILHKCFSEGILEFTQKALATELGVSTSTINNALRLPRASGAVEVRGRGFRLQDKEKFLLLWASHRNLSREVIYQTALPNNPHEIEGLMPPGIIYGAYSAYVKRFSDPPADYDTVYIYAAAGGLAELKKRFPARKGPANLTVLRADARLSDYGSTTPEVQTFVDLWNLPQWYAKDFLNALREKLRL